MDLQTQKSEKWGSGNCNEEEYNIEYLELKSKKRKISKGVLEDNIKKHKKKRIGIYTCQAFIDTSKGA